MWLCYSNDWINKEPKWCCFCCCCFFSIPFSYPLLQRENFSDYLLAIGVAFNLVVCTWFKIIQNEQESSVESFTFQTNKRTFSLILSSFSRRTLKSNQAQTSYYFYFCLSTEIMHLNTSTHTCMYVYIKHTHTHADIQILIQTLNEWA